MRRGIWGEPLQYILGKEHFGPSGVEIAVCRGVLVPRCATNDILAEMLIEQLTMSGEEGI